LCACGQVSWGHHSIRTTKWVGQVWSRPPSSTPCRTGNLSLSLSLSHAAHTRACTLTPPLPLPPRITAQAQETASLLGVDTLHPISTLDLGTRTSGADSGGQEFAPLRAPHEQGSGQESDGGETSSWARNVQILHERAYSSNPTTTTSTTTTRSTITAQAAGTAPTPGVGASGSSRGVSNASNSGTRQSAASTLGAMVGFTTGVLVAAAGAAVTGRNSQSVF
jgi:hypothetical protein